MSPSQHLTHVRVRVLVIIPLVSALESSNRSISNNMCKDMDATFLQAFDDDGFQDWEPLLSVDEQDGRSYGNVGKASH